jgi:anhydro-N-acetylmuramic acid kinase
MLLNEICKRISLMYDKEGRLARMGKVIPDLLEKWNQIAFYKQEAPKSLGREWFADNYLTDLQNMNYDTSDLLNTAHLHIATQIAKFISGIAHHADIKRNITILTTGGGAHNSYLIELLKKQDESLNFIIPDSQLIDFKEAIVFALLGYLRWRNEININSSVTGAIRDHSSGDIYS